MAATAISYGTQCWLAELAQAGWNLTISEQRRLYVDDLGAFTEKETVGVLATLPGSGPGASGFPSGSDSLSGVFVPCSGEDDARRLLERIEAEVGEA